MDTMILPELTPPDKAKVTNTSPDDSDPLKLADVNCISNTIVIMIQPVVRYLGIYWNIAIYVI